MSQLNTNSVLPEFLLDLHAVVAVYISNEGDLIEANAGFYNLIPIISEYDNTLNLREFFIQPTFSVLTSQTSNEKISYKGMLTLGNRVAKTYTLNGTFYRKGCNWLMIAEHNVDELEQLRLLLSNLNRDLAQKQRDLSRANRQLILKNKQIEQLSLIDPLTGIGNRRQLEKTLHAEIERTRREHGECSLIMCDIDNFKLINDNFGHDMGDKVLEKFGELISQHIRPSDFSARYGGEEFIILMPGVSTAKAMLSAERLRLALSKLQIDMLPNKITASFGVSELIAGDSPETFIKRADSAMYKAKKTGKNRVESAH